MQVASSFTYTPTCDAIDRHDYGVSKNRKPASTGGGRAWSDDEEVYLLQTRLQKMPYKHIAAHLKKTELACRLHYHQLSHGSNRRKRTTSVSSASSGGCHSPILSASVPSPIHEYSPTPSPPGSSDSYGSDPSGLQLPSNMAAAVSSGSSVSSPRLPTILPKPASMALPLVMGPSAVPRTYSPSLSDGSPLVSSLQSASLLPAATFSSSSPSHSAPGIPGVPNLRLDCTSLPPAPHPFSGLHKPIDMTRLQAVYMVHRLSFWDKIATDYGSRTSPLVLEQAWRAGSMVPGIGIHHQQTATPLTPGTTPDDRDLFYSVKGSQDKTRISAILGIDANPRSPKERELVRKLEEERATAPTVA
ncbi:hypothetical protein CMQ_7755 [Grosmannia clavigera kw1407]|uniref:Myb-like domain-containing protein n=1 Tax=Grosmannia clavigera (strain kw1407 / UAMH 11150) TaxID=655863 RepID=F0XAU7_GROCL|nr:uncharacterized protein CMQ_7755 [Grosmannia clavigera kw1407]EFX05193.1 hypothetical protein CMQ_7755 [Grosmannia clavigera kw1407]